VAVLDSGIDNSSRPEYGENPFANKVVYAQDFTSETNKWYDTDGHGTHVAGIIASTNTTYKGIAYGCQLVNLKIGTLADGILLEWYTAAVDWCISHKDAYNIRIINLSMGFDGPCDGTCSWCRKAEEAIEAGIIFIAASGNEEGGAGYGSVSCPACSFNVIAVGACDDYRTGGIADDTLSLYSCKGPTADNRPKPDVLAPGGEYYHSLQDMRGIWSCRSLYAEDYRYEATNGRFGRKEGTSVAAPHVSGTIALMLQANPSLTQAQVKAIIRQTARLNNHISGLTLNDRGYGIIDAYQAVYVAQHIILINPNLTFDEYSVVTPLLWEIGPTVYTKSFSFNVNRTSYGIDLRKLWIDMWMIGSGGSYEYKYNIFESVKTPYLWIDGSLKNLAAYHLCLSSGPRVSEKGDGYVTIRAQYKIGDVTAQLNYYVSVNKVQPWVLLSSSGSHSYSKLMYLDVALRGQDHDFATYSNGTPINNEIRLTNTEIEAEDNPPNHSWPYLQCQPNLGSPYTWVLKNDGAVYDNPDNNPPLNGESVYNTDIVLYYKYPSGYPGPVTNIKY
jgi:serine protease AprX